AVVADEGDEASLGLRDVGDSLEKALDHTTGIELEGDLLAEPPHTLQHAPGVLELARAAGDRLLELGLEQALVVDVARQLGRCAVLTREQPPADEGDDAGDRRQAEQLDHDGSADLARQT